MNLNRRVVYILPGTFILLLLLLDVLGGSCPRAHWTVARQRPATLPTIQNRAADERSQVPRLQTAPIPVAREKIALTPGETSDATPSEPGAGASPQPRVRGIRGMSAAGLIAGLQAAGLRCSTPSIHGDELVWACRRGAEGAEWSVVVVAPATDEPPVSVSATATQAQADPSDLKAGLWLAWIATLPYEGASPLVAREWVLAHVARGGETHFGDARFRLSGSPSARTLDIVAPGDR
jgi:hypothetical protein